MVDSLSAAKDGGYGYSSPSQAVNVTVRTEQDTLATQVTQGGSRETLHASRYSESVTISIGSGAGAASLILGESQTSFQAQTQSDQQALVTVEQTADEARDFLKNDAKKKLQNALAELQLLKLLGNTPAGAKQAARIAKEIADAATQYAEGGGGTDATAAAAAAAASDTAAQSTTGQNTAGQGTATPPAAAAAGSAVASAATPAQQDPFYQSVDAALAELKKYLKKTLPGLETAPDRKTRRTAKEVAESFEQSLVQVADAEAAFNAESGAGGAADATAALGGADSAAAAAAALVASSYQPVNLTV